jgi:hypothetical protein
MNWQRLRFLPSILILLGLAACARQDRRGPAMDNNLFEIDTSLESRAISFENPTGEKGKGGTAASPLGVGRKGSPARMIAPGEEVQLCDIQGPGTIRHIWATTLNVPLTFRGAVLRAWWDDQAHPSIEAPLGDLFGFAHGKVMAYQSAVHSIGENAALNLWLPMPFTKRARLTLTNESTIPMALFYQIDYTLKDKHPSDVGRLHVLFRRENLTMKGKDFELLPKRTGKGRLLGSVIGVRYLDSAWWGEGEMKAYIDGDTEFPTICGTGSEDYVGLSFGMQQTPFLYHGCSLNQNQFVSMYRWHHLDPIFWQSDIRVTIQQIGHRGTSMRAEDYMDQLYEREDDWSAATFWYEPVPSEPLPPLPIYEERIKDLFRAAKNE